MRFEHDIVLLDAELLFAIEVQFYRSAAHA